MTKNICIFAKSKSGTPLCISGLEAQVNSLLITEGASLAEHEVARLLELDNLQLISHSCNFSGSLDTQLL